MIEKEIIKIIASKFTISGKKFTKMVFFHFKFNNGNLILKKHKKMPFNIVKFNLGLFLLT